MPTYVPNHLASERVRPWPQLETTEERVLFCTLRLVGRGDPFQMPEQVLGMPRE